MKEIKWGHPSAFIDRHPTPSDPWAICEATVCSFAQYNTKNILNSVMCYPDLLCNVWSMSQGVHITVFPYQSISHPLYVYFKSHKYRPNFKGKFCSCKVLISNFIQRVLTFSDMHLLYNMMI